MKKTATRRQKKSGSLVAFLIRLDPKTAKILRMLSEKENLSLSAIVSRIIAKSVGE